MTPKERDRPEAAVTRAERIAVARRRLPLDVLERRATIERRRRRTAV